MVWEGGARAIGGDSGRRKETRIFWKKRKRKRQERRKKKERLFPEKEKGKRSQNMRERKEGRRDSLKRF